MRTGRIGTMSTLMHLKEMPRTQRALFEIGYLEHPRAISSSIEQLHKAKLIYIESFARSKNETGYGKPAAVWAAQPTPGHFADAVRPAPKHPSKPRVRKKKVAPLQDDDGPRLVIDPIRGVTRHYLR